ncbi:MAG: glycosyltransferase family 4 protein [Planctomycetia bacterium]|nr:glycosyltransferase family 4 protein [Planctomycetia bacterium]
MGSLATRIFRKLGKGFQYPAYWNLCKREIPALSEAEKGKKRVLFVHPLMALGGGERVTRDLLAGLDRERFVADMAVVCRNPLRPNLFENELRAVADHLWDIPALVGSLFNVEFFAKLLKTRRYHHILWIGGNSYLHFLRPILRRRCWGRSTYVIHNDWPEFLADAAQNQDICDDFIAVCDYIREKLHAWEGVSKEKVTVLHNGIHTEVFDRSLYPKASYRPSLGISEDDFVVSYTTRLDAEKHPEYFLSIAEELSDLPQIKFILAGDGILRETIRQQIEAAGLAERIFLPGMIYDVPQLLSESDLYCHCVRYEAWGLSIMEALSMGLPAVVTKVGGIPEFFEDGVHGRMIPYDDQTPHHAAEAIREIFSDPHRERYRAVNRARAEQFSVERMVASYERQLLKTELDF